MSTLLIDLGNSRLKWAWLDAGHAGAMAALDHRQQDLAQLLDTNWLQQARPERVLVASVADPVRKASLADWCERHWSLTPEFLYSPAQAHGIRNAYGDPAQLGCDRWAAMVAAYHLQRAAVCVVDCGSAVTVDVLAADGQHLGGLIAPGLTAMHAALTGHTALTPVSRDDLPAAAVLGGSTRDGILLGIHRSIAALVEDTLDKLQQQQAIQAHCYLTGGDAAAVATYLSVSHQLVPDLVLQGLAVIANAT